jgi:methylenetetrahydrofolate reductase (NADPH)
MISTFRHRRRALVLDDPALLAARGGLLRAARWELVPIKSIEPAIEALPPASSVSVSCSPVKGVDVTLEVCARLIDAGHDAAPHIAARMVEDRAHTRRIAEWSEKYRPSELFVIAGDAETPSGPYEGAAAFLRDLLDSGVSASIGIAGYPDGHPLIDVSQQREHLHRKQTLISEAGGTASITTQMCFDIPRIIGWTEEQRADGIRLPIRLGIPGVVDRARLLTLGTRLGIGQSLRYLRKNRAAIGQLVAPGGYDPTVLVDGVGARAADLGITGLHVFTFNALADSLAWADGLLHS